MTKRPGSKRPEPSGKLRIIGGSWRGRKLSIPPHPELRPTPDRVRETLFNWLAPYIRDANCLDLFSGSGALGLEALSRGATHVSLVDYSAAVCSQLNQNLQILGASNAQVERADVVTWLQNKQPPGYDLVFLDPPYRQQLLEPCCELLVANNLLNKEAFIYVESAADETAPTVPGDWELHREKTAGQVRYQLYQAIQEWNSRI